MSVLAILVVMLMGIVDSSAKLWRENENRVDAFRESRAALNVMARDFRNAVPVADTNFFLINGDAYETAPDDAEQDTNNAGAVFFLTQLSPQAQWSSDPNANKGEVCEVGYFLAYGKSSVVTNAPLTTMNLYRYYRGSDATYSNAAATNTFSPRPTLIGAETELLARNITSFRLIPYGTNSSGTIVPFTPTTNNPLPVMVEIQITALNQEASKKMNSKSDWKNPPAGLSNVVRQVQQTFTTRVRVNDHL